MTSSGFQSTLPAWGETKNLECRHLFPFISIHSPRMGRDVLVLAILQLLRYFNPLSPHGERPRHGDADCRTVHFNPLSPHGERRWLYNFSTSQKEFQSTLPAWGETSAMAGNKAAKTISIHSPRMGRDAARPPLYRRYFPFQSTLPAWGETGDGAGRSPPSGIFQSTLPAWGETEGRLCDKPKDNISIHSPRMGRDYPIGKGSIETHDFNPLSPHGERHYEPSKMLPDTDISIHSPRMGRDKARPAAPAGDGGDFNPLSPHGERRTILTLTVALFRFQSTLPAWGETSSFAPLAIVSDFNPLSPHGERRASRPARGICCNFNPLSPHGERPGCDL